jgi:hypothetical protein
VSLILVAGTPWEEAEEAARHAAVRLGFQFIGALEIETRMRAELPGVVIPDAAWPDLASSMLAKAALEHHLVIAPGREGQYFEGVVNVLRVGIGVPGDLALVPSVFSPAAMGAIIAAAAESNELRAAGLLDFAAEAHLQFQSRLRLAEHGIAAPGAPPRRPGFSHPSEEIFANLLDFYRIAWEYEPRSFPIAWDEAGAVAEYFTPDFYLPEMDTYVELTTMKQSLVTKKNRKVRLLREHHPQVTIQILYQKDFEHLIFKYNLSAQPA